jgi:HPt (histidine-containing phosphotransfer) domain-containing protein
MNDHVGKPFDLQHLVEVLLHHTKFPGTTAPSPRESTSLPAANSVDAIPVNELPPEDAFDSHGALQRMGGNTDLYVRVLQQFITDIKDMSLTLGQSLLSGDMASAARTIHTIKGLSSTIGADYLAAVTRSAEVAIKTPDAKFNAAILLEDLRKAVESTVRVAGAIAQSISRSPPVVQDEGGNTFDKVQFLHDLNALQTLLSQFDLNAVKVYADLLAAHGSQIGDAIEDLNSAMRGLDFEKAGVACEHLRRKAF